MAQAFFSCLIIALILLAAIVVLLGMAIKWLKGLPKALAALLDAREEKAFNDAMATSHYEEVK